ncbi:MAG TPA: hypothetical protein VNA22_10350, partial [Pyrinomonadaceae bacterium]|nr:hypothetical protein [Pyrinomonadaceae bacterium]
MKHYSVFAAVIFVAIFLVTPAPLAAQTCNLDFRAGAPDTSFDSIFTQDGPGLGLEPAGLAGWTGGDSTYSIELPNGDTA